MRFSNTFKVVWWLTVLIAVTIILFLRFDHLTSDTFSFLDIFFFLLWIILILLPIFQEINFFGIKVKTSISELKDNFDKQIGQLRMDLSQKIDFNPIINLNPSSEDKLKEQESEFSKILQNKGTNAKKFIDSDLNIVDIPEDNEFLFKVRFKIEQEIRRLWSKHNDPLQIMDRKEPISKMVQDLVERNFISKELIGILKDTIAIANLGIHGEKITESQMHFVKNVGTGVIALIEEL